MEEWNYPFIALFILITAWACLRCGEFETLKEEKCTTGAMGKTYIGHSDSQHELNVGSGSYVVADQ